MLLSRLQPGCSVHSSLASRNDRLVRSQPVAHAAPAMRPSALAREWAWRSMVVAAQRHVACAAVVDEDEELSEQTSTAGGFEALLEELGLPLPDVRHQRKLDMKAIKALRTTANTAAKEKTLVYAQVGQAGITATFLSSAMDVLQKHELVRIKIGEGSGLERKTTAKALEQLLDAVCVHQVGFTVTMFRQRGLPRPSNCASNRPEDVQGSAQEGAEEGQDAVAADGTVVVVAAPPVHGKGGKTNPKGKKPAKGPPEFEVL